MSKRVDCILLPHSLKLLIVESNSSKNSSQRAFLGVCTPLLRAEYLKVFNGSDVKIKSWGLLQHVGTNIAAPKQGEVRECGTQDANGEVSA